MSQSDTPAKVGSMEGLGLVERLREMSRRGYWPLLGDEAADEIVGEKAAVGHLADASDEGNEGAHDGHEAGENNGATTVFFEKGVGALEVLFAEKE